MASVLLNRHRLRAPELRAGRAPVGPTVLNRAHPLAKGLVGWWRFDEGSGSTAYDSSGNGNDGTLQNMEEGDWVTGRNKSGYALDLDGSNEYVNIPAPDTDFLGPITIMQWAKIDTGSAYRHFAGKHLTGGGTNNPFDFRTDNKATPLMNFIRANAGGFRAYEGPAVTLGAWKHYAVVSTAAEIYTTPTFYIGGASTAGSLTSGGGSGNVTGSGADIRLGDRADSVVTMDGKIDDVRIYNRALTAAEIRRIIRYPYEILQPPGPKYLTFSTGAAGSYSMVAAQGPFTLTGQDSSLLAARMIEAEQGSYALTGITAELVRQFLLAAEQGTFTLTGQDSDLFASRILSAAQAAFVLTGQNAQLTKAIIMEALYGAFSLSGQDAGVLANRLLSTVQGFFALTGQDVEFTKAFIMAAEQGVFTVTGQESGLLASRLLGLTAGSFSLSGQDAALARRFTITAAGGSYALTGQDAALIVSRLLSGEYALYELTGADAGLTHGGAVAAEVAQITMTLSTRSVTFSLRNRSIELTLQ